MLRPCTSCCAKPVIWRSKRRIRRLAERAISMLAGRYAIEPLQELTAALEEMTGKPHPADANRAIAEAALGRVEEAQADE